MGRQLLRIPRNHEEQDSLQLESVLRIVHLIRNSWLYPNISKTKKAMSKDEVSLLVDLIQSHSIIITKDTNAATNKLKEESSM